MRDSSIPRKSGNVKCCYLEFEVYLNSFAPFPSISIYQSIYLSIYLYIYLSTYIFSLFFSFALYLSPSTAPLPMRILFSLFLLCWCAERTAVTISSLSSFSRIDFSQSKLGERRDGNVWVNAANLIQVAKSSDQEGLFGASKDFKQLAANFKAAAAGGIAGAVHSSIWAAAI